MSKLLAVAVASLALLCTSQAFADQLGDTNYTGHYFFGDSNSDDGNLYTITGGTNPPSPPYSQRFTNGLVFPEYLAPGLQRITQSPTGADIDFAFGGATAAPATNPPGFAQQIGLFNGLGRTLGPHDLVSVYFGANDFYNAVALPANQNATAVDKLALSATTNIISGVQTLIADGGRNFIVFNQPDQGATPAFSGSPAHALANQYTTSFNADLRTALASAVGAAPADARFTLIDVHALYARLMADPAAFGLSNVTSAYLPVVSGNVNQFMFFDTVHVTDTVQRIEAMYVNEALNPQWALASAPALSRASLASVNLATENTITRLNSLHGGDNSCGAGRSSVYAGDNYADINARGDGASFATDVSGNMWNVGGEIGLTCDVTAGLAINIGNASGRTAASRYDMDSGIASIYALWRANEHVAVDASIGGGSVQIDDIKRQTNVPGIVTSGSTAGSLFAAHIRASYAIPVTAAFTISPVAGFRTERARLDGYSERNGAGLDFSYHAQSVTSTFGTLGLLAEARAHVGGVAVSLHGSAEYLHDFNDGTRRVSGALFDNFTPDTDVAVDDGAGDRVNVGAGVDAMLTSRLGLHLDYVSTLPQHGDSSHRVAASVSWAF